jgi:hypothetical protein
MSIRIKIASDCPEKKAYRWVVETFGSYVNQPIDFEDTAELIIGGDHGNWKYNDLFWKNVRTPDFDSSDFLDPNGYVCFEDASRDLWMTAFFYINCLFENDRAHLKDEIGRSEFSHSIWKRKSIDFENCFVNRVFDEICKQLAIQKSNRETVVWLSHDIDVMNGAWLQDGKWLLKNNRFWLFFKNLAKHFFKKPQWTNLSEIATLEKQFNVVSTFFMLTQKGRIDQRKTNSDYQISDKNVQVELDEIQRIGSEIGLHKSLNNKSYQAEMDLLFPVTLNRNHYLKLNWPSQLHEMAGAGIKLDSSLGYAEMFGYRNGYSLPFYSFDIAKNCVIPVLEVPLVFMDGTFSSYLKTDPKKVIDIITDKIEKNQFNSVISVLWHNTHFTNFKYEGFPNVYKQLLTFIQDKSIHVVTGNDLLHLYPFFHSNGSE